MSIQRNLGKTSIGAIFALSLAFINNANAQEISADHLKAAKDAISALDVTSNFDNILPLASERLKGVLIQANPNFSDEISITVDEEAIKLAGRRADLEEEAATIYAKKFTAEELTKIAEFYNSDLGKKLLKDSPAAGRELVRAAEIWAGGINRDLGAAANQALQEKLANVSSEEAATTEAESTETSN